MVNAQSKWQKRHRIYLCWLAGRKETHPTNMLVSRSGCQPAREALNGCEKSSGYTDHAVTSRVSSKKPAGRYEPITADFTMLLFAEQQLEASQDRAHMN